MRVQPPSARLEASPASLEAGMLRAVPGAPGEPDEVRQTNVEFTVRNVGGSPTGPIHVRIPSTPWMTLASPALLPSLEPDGAATVVLTLAPAATLPLGPYTGTIVLEGSAASLVAPFRFINTSDGVGDLVVYAEDEFTYYAEGNPPLAGAEVRIIDPQTHQTVITGLTGADGTVRFSDLTEGAYGVEVRAERHGTYRGLATVSRGGETFHAAFLPRQVVRYSWRVDPDAVEDRYRFVIDTEFETNVPIPQLVIDPPFVDVTEFESTTAQVNFTVTNHGLIRANGVRARFSGDDSFEVSPLVEDIGDIEPGQSVVVPVIFRDVRRGVGGGDICGIRITGYFEHYLVCDVRRYYLEAVSFRLPEVFCPGSGGGGGSTPGEPGSPGSPGRPHVNEPGSPQVPRPCSCPDLLVVFFTGGPTRFVCGDCGSSALRAIGDRVKALAPDRVDYLVVGPALTATDQLIPAHAWITWKSIGCDPPPKVMLVGHSYGGDTIRNSGSIDAQVRIAADPINRALVSLVHQAPPYEFCTHQRQFEFAPPPNLVMNALATRDPAFQNPGCVDPVCQSCTIPSWDCVRPECLFGHFFAGSPHIFIENSNHGDIIEKQQFVDLVVGQARNLLGLQ